MERSLERHFTRDGEGRYVIDLAVCDLDDLFNPLDPAPLHERHLARAATDHIVEQMIVLPKDSKLVLVLHLPKKYRTERIERQVETAIRNHFTFRSLGSDLHLRRRLKKGARFFAGGIVLFFVLVTTSTYLQTLEPRSFWMSVLGKSLEIGSWVSVAWPFQTLFYEWFPLYDERTRFTRILNMHISFRYV